MIAPNGLYFSIDNIPGFTYKEMLEVAKEKYPFIWDENNEDCLRWFKEYFLRDHITKVYFNVCADYTDANSVKLRKLADSMTRLDTVENPLALLRKADTILKGMK